MAVTAAGLAGMLLGFGLLAVVPPNAVAQGTGRRTEVSIALDFEAALARVMPLFGMFEERRWDPSWDPRAVRADEEGVQRPGVVFTTADRHPAVWVLTDYDLANGLIRYVIVRAGFALTELRIQGTATGSDRTHVVVTYRITALSDEGAAYVEHFESEFPHAGPHWQAAVSGALREEHP